MTLTSSPRTVPLVWHAGNGVLDRWGLLWRADTRMPDGYRGWQCRSVGMRLWSGTRQLDEQRGPLRDVALPHDHIDDLVGLPNVVDIRVLGRDEAVA